MTRQRRTPQRMVGINQPKFQQLERAKAVYEQDMGKKADWGSFLLFLGLAYLVSRAIDQRRDYDDKGDEG